MRTKIMKSRKRKFSREEKVTSGSKKISRMEELNDEDFSWKDHGDDPAPMPWMISERQDRVNNLSGEFDLFPKMIMHSQVTLLSEPENTETSNFSINITSMNLDEFVLLYAKHQDGCIPECLVAYILYLILDRISNENVVDTYNSNSQILLHSLDGIWSCELNDNSESHQEDGKWSLRLICVAIWILLGIKCNYENCSLLIPFVTKNVYYKIKWHKVFSLLMEGNFEGAITSLGDFDVKKAKGLLDSLIRFKTEGGDQDTSLVSCCIDDHLNSIGCQHLPKHYENRNLALQSLLSTDKEVGNTCYIINTNGTSSMTNSEIKIQQGNNHYVEKCSYLSSTEAHEQDRIGVTSMIMRQESHEGINYSPKFVRYGRIVIPLDDSEELSD